MLSGSCLAPRLLCYPSLSHVICSLFWTIFSFWYLLSLFLKHSPCFTWLTLSSSFNHTLRGTSKLPVLHCPPPTREWVKCPFFGPQLSPWISRITTSCIPCLFAWLASWGQGQYLFCSWLYAYLVHGKWSWQTRHLVQFWGWITELTNYSLNDSYVITMTASANICEDLTMHQGLFW